MRDVTRVLIGVALAVASAAPGLSAPLCRDSKGLFTPCTGERAPSARRQERRSAGRDQRHADPAPGRPAKPPIVSRSRLCRDGKGLFTPCPR